MMAATIGPAPFQLVDYRVDEQSLLLSPTLASEGVDEGAVNLAFDFKAESLEPGDVQLGLRVRINDLEEGETLGATDVPYIGRVSVVGRFHWLGGDDDPVELRRLLTVNGLSMLYGIARVYVRQLATSAGGRGLILPTLSFVEAGTRLADDFGQGEISDE